MLAEALETVFWLQQYTTPAFFILLAVAWIYKEVTMGVCHSSKRLDGKVAIVTGTYRKNRILLQWQIAYCTQKTVKLIDLLSLLNSVTITYRVFQPKWFIPNSENSIRGIYTQLRMVHETMNFIVLVSYCFCN